MATEYTFPENAAKAPAAAQEFGPERMSISMGPSHPSTHGVLRLQLELDGEVVTKADPVVGYLHRGDEKIAENMTYNQFVPYTDRLDYLAPLANNVAYAIAVERLAGLEMPPRCQATRVVISELARISSHLMGLGAFGIDVGAWTVFLYTFTEREKLYRLFEELTGARFTTSYTRIGGAGARRSRRLARPGGGFLRSVPADPGGNARAPDAEPDLRRPDGRHRRDQPGRTRSPTD